MVGAKRLSLPPFKKDYNFTVDDVRRAELSDLEHLKNLITNQTNALFGNVDPAELLDKCQKSVCLYDFDEEPVAFICLEDHPNVPSIPPWGWEHWLQTIYNLETINPRNSLWMHLVVCDKTYTYIFLAPMLKQVFAFASFLEYIVMVVPPGIYNVNWLEGQATRIVPPGVSEPHKVQTLYLLLRQSFVTKYKVRGAVEEDNDDLVPLIHAHSVRLQQIYGEFYISEILTRHPDSGRKLIVAEYDEHAVSVLFLNETINIDLLNDYFELVPFNGLRKPHEDDVVENTQLQYQTSEVTIVQEEDQTENNMPLTEGETISNLEEEKEEEQLEVEEEKEEVDEEENIEEKDAELVEDSTESEDSADDFTIIDVSSADFMLESAARDLYTLSSSDNYSAIILSLSDYEMHLFTDKNLQRMLSIHNTENYISKNLKTCRDLPAVSSFHGLPNAFVLELAASKSEHELASLALLLEAAFECFPERDYCVLTIPSTCPPFSLLAHFTRVSPRLESTFPHELYVLHRNSILSKMFVRLAMRSDIPVVEELAMNIVKAEHFINQFISAVSENEGFRAFVLLSENQIVGVAILRQEDDFEYLKSHYELSYWIDDNHHKSDSHGLLEHLILSPIFSRHACFFLREIHRLSDFSVLYYCIFPTDTTSSYRQRSLCCILRDLIAIRPRPTPEFNHSDLEGCSPPYAIHRLDPPFALYVSTARHCNLPHYEINTKIVVVGSSDTAIAFLESLICSWSTSYRIRFTNVTVISPHELSYRKPSHRIRDMMFVTKNNYNHRYMNLICLRTFLNNVTGVMTGIQRRDKLVIVNENKCVSYDLLFLMCGRQFQKPMSTVKDKKQKKVTEFPENVFLVNTERDAMNSLIQLRKLIRKHSDKPYKVVVYGCVLEAYCCLAALLEFGVPGRNITFIESYPDVTENKSETHVHQFPDIEVDESVHDSIKEEGIKMYQSYYFCEWTINKDLNRVTSVKFESSTRRVEVDCIAMFMYNCKTVSARTFLAISQAGLVFDGALVIGPDCRTNDPSIYAAGTITKYARRYYADHKAHKYYNLEEIGWKLGQKIRKKIIPFYNEDTDTDPISCKPGDMLVPDYHKPLITYCHLPGKLRYFSVCKPGKPVPMEVAMSSDDYGQVFITGSCKQLDKQGYFRLHLNEYGVVETITCLAKFDIDRNNLTSLWGKHEKLLNNLQTRFEMVFIMDLYEYFREPWSCAIYHDRFHLLENSISDLLTSLTDVEGESPAEDLLRMFKLNNWNHLTVDQREEIEEKFANSPYHKLLEQKLLDFLRDNDTFLPMYAHPTIVRWLLQGTERSPLFEPQ